MSISTNHNLCEGSVVNTWPQTSLAWLVTLALAATGFSASAETTNLAAGSNNTTVSNRIAATNVPTPAEASKPPAAAAPSQVEASPSRFGAGTNKLDESAFAIISERNIFNATRSGGQVRMSTRRPTSVESFTLVGTMAYEKGVFAFFEGSSSEFTKAIKADGIIAGHKLAEIYAGSVKLEADGKQIDLPVGSQMRREDAGTWRVSEATGSTGDGESSGYSSRRNGGSSSRRNGTAEPAARTPVTAAPSAKDQSEILKKLMERREKE